MTCPNKKCRERDTRTVRTVPGETPSREHRCDRCGARWWSDQRLRTGTLLIAANSTPVAYQQQPDDTPVAGRQPSHIGGGVGGGLPSGSGSDPESGPISVDPPIRARARSRRRAAPTEYPDAFIVVWEQTGKRGGKFPALAAWEKVGRPPWTTIAPAWRAYLLSERPRAGFVKDLSSWLNARGHEQEWPPASAARAPLPIDDGRARATDRKVAELRRAQAKPFDERERAAVRDLVADLAGQKAVTG